MRPSPNVAEGGPARGDTQRTGQVTPQALLKPGICAWTDTSNSVNKKYAARVNSLFSLSVI